MTESAEKRVSVKIYLRTRDELEDQKISIKRKTGKEPDYAELIAKWIETGKAALIGKPPASAPEKAAVTSPWGAVTPEETELMEALLMLLRDEKDPSRSTIKGVIRSALSIQLDRIKAARARKAPKAS